MAETRQRRARAAGPNIGPDAQDQPPPAPKWTPTDKDLHAKLCALLLTLETPFVFQGDVYCAGIIESRGPILASALVDLSKENRAVRSWLQRAVEGGAIGAVLVAAASIAVPIMQHHGVIPGADPFAFVFPNPADPRADHADRSAAAQRAARDAAAAQADASAHHPPPPGQPPSGAARDGGEPDFPGSLRGASGV